MRRSTLIQLCCPACKRPYDVDEQGGSDQRVETAFLTCPSCCITVPLLNGFPIFEEQRLTQRWDTNEQISVLFGEETAYLSFLQQKRFKPVYDLYAAFQPFNESTQCIFPLIPLFQEIVQPGDFILDLWCRTGWTGELLASLFPDQQVISMWESSSGLLGTKGFHYWLGSEKRRSNLDILFHSPNHPLPFPDGMFAVVHGLDTLHRYKHVPLISECLRVVAKSGAIVFPHNHLTNSEPEPYFDRGEDQIHGLVYQEYFSRVLQDSNKKAFVLSEKDLFDAKSDFVLEDQANTDHYNGCILIVDSRFDGSSFHQNPKTLPEYANAFAIVNPLWNISASTGIAVPAPDVMDGGGATLFFRHPIYDQRLKEFTPVKLEEQERILLYWAARLKTVSEIASISGFDRADVFKKLLNLESRELIQIQNISPAMAALQSFYSTQRVTYHAKEETLFHLWRNAIRLHGERPFIVWPEDGSTFTYNDADTVVRMAASLLIAKGIVPGDRVLIESTPHPEFLIALWAALLLGAVVIPVSSEMKSNALLQVVQQTGPRLILTTSGLEMEHDQTLYFGLHEDSQRFPGSFSDELSNYDDSCHFPPALPEQPAVILFTSGSTGTPKGILLSHGALFRTSRIIDEAYGWRKEDRFLGGGSFHTMSGLRNPCISPLHSGASLVIPGQNDLQNPISILTLCVKHDVTILNVTPAFLGYWGPASLKSRYFQTHKLRMVLSTGSALQSIHREIFEKQFHCPVYDYYGLTETTGACILETKELATVAEKGIGKPWESIVKICADGELAVYSENLMLGYLNDAKATERRIQKGWLMTGDIARVNQDDCIVLIGRKDRRIKDRNGELVYAEQIESILLEMNEVADVYVTTYRGHLSIDHIAALIQLQDSADPEAQFNRMREVLAEKIPAAQIPNLFVPVSRLNRGTAGKISKVQVDSILSQYVTGRDESQL